MNLKVGNLYFVLVLPHEFHSFILSAVEELSVVSNTACQRFIILFESQFSISDHKIVSVIHEYLGRKWILVFLKKFIEFVCIQVEQQSFKIFFSLLFPIL